MAKKQKCGGCTGCLAPKFCETCSKCRNMVRFGGNGKWKEPCAMRKCVGQVQVEVGGGQMQPEEGQVELQDPVHQVEVGGGQMQHAEGQVDLEDPVHQLEADRGMVQQAEGQGGPLQLGGEVNENVEDIEPVVDEQDLNEEAANRNLVAKILGFAKTRGKTFWPARRSSLIVSSSLLRVQFFGTGVVALVDPNSWVGFTEEVKQQLSRAESSSSFALAMQELEAAKARVERDGEDELDCVLRQVEKQTKLPTGRRELTKLSTVNLQHSSRITDAAFKDFILVQENGDFKCRECPKFNTQVRVIARKHARFHGVAKKPQKKPATEKKHFCSKPGCGQAFALVSKCDDHYMREHSSPEGGYKCWTCSTSAKSVILKFQSSQKIGLFYVWSVINRATPSSFKE